MRALDAPHGTSRRYDHGTRSTPPCRCGPCRNAKTTIRERQRRLAGYGRSSMIDPGPVREHVEKLHREFGLGVKRIAVLAGVSITPVRGLLDRGRRGPSLRIRRDVAAKLFAVAPTLDDLADHTLTNSCGTRRRLQALVAGGRPLMDIAQEIGLGRTTINALAHGLYPTVRAGTARTIRDATNRLCHQPPPQATAAQRRRADAARRLAARHGWVPFVVWEEIDNPAETPVLDLPVDQDDDEDGDSHVVDAFLAQRVTWDQMSLANRRLVVRWCRRRDWKQAEIAERAQTHTEAVEYHFRHAKDAA